MRYALVNGNRQDAQPKLRGACPNCEREVVSKCGQRRIWHWSHVGKLECDHWWEPETEWHRDWKNQFPENWQEVRQVAENGEAHIADVRTPRGEVIEFQYSALHPDELAAREAFYGPQMAWIASGTRLKRDAEAFRRAVFSASPDFTTDLRAWWLPAAKAPAIIQRWAGSRRKVFLDFGDVDFSALKLSFNFGLLWHVIFQPGIVSFMPVLKNAVIGHYLNETQLLGFETHSAENQRLLLALEAQLARRGRRRFR